MKVSIVTISYNQAKFLEEAVRSVLQQGYENIEYVVVDPGSTDNSRDIIDRYRSRISKVIIEPDKGPADGLNKGFSCATGEIFGYLNADDRFVPGALKFVSEFFSANPSVDVLCGAIRIIDREGRASIRKRTSDNFDLVRYAAGICTVNQQATFFRRGAFERAGGFNRDNRIAWDGELLVDMALAGCKFATVSKVLGEFRLYNESITGSRGYRDKQLKDLRRLSQKICNSNIRIYSRWGTAIMRLFYKFNIRRHLGYFLVR